MTNPLRVCRLSFCSFCCCCVSVEIRFFRHQSIPGRGWGVGGAVESCHWWMMENSVCCGCIALYRSVCLCCTVYCTVSRLASLYRTVHCIVSREWLVCVQTGSSVPHCAQHSVKAGLFLPHCALHNVKAGLFLPHCALHSVKAGLSVPHCAQHDVQVCTALCTAQCPGLYRTVHSTVSRVACLCPDWLVCTALCTAQCPDLSRSVPHCVQHDVQVCTALYTAQCPGWLVCTAVSTARCPCLYRTVHSTMSRLGSCLHGDETFRVLSFPLPAATGCLLSDARVSQVSMLIASVWMSRLLTSLVRSWGLPGGPISSRQISLDTALGNTAVRSSVTESRCLHKVL